jgi:hypothetical protein
LNLGKLSFFIEHFHSIQIQIPIFLRQSANAHIQVAKYLSFIPGMGEKILSICVQIYIFLCVQFIYWRTHSVAPTRCRSRATLTGAVVCGTKAVAAVIKFWYIHI